MNYNEIMDFYKYIYPSYGGNYVFQISENGNCDRIDSGSLPEVLHSKDCYFACDGDWEAYCNMDLPYTYVEELLPPFPEERWWGCTGEKHIFKNSKFSYRISKTVDGNLKYFGSFKTLEEAKKRRDDLIAVDWDDSLLPPVSKPKPKYYTLSKTNKWVVKRWRNDKTVYFGCYDSKDIARKIIGRLEKCGWDKQQLQRIEQEVIG